MSSRNIILWLLVLGHACYAQRFLEVVSRIVRRPLTHAQVFNRNQSFPIPVYAISEFPSVSLSKRV